MHTLKEAHLGWLQGMSQGEKSHNLLISCQQGAVVEEDFLRDKLCIGRV
jgi:hypothetical protein